MSHDEAVISHRPGRRGVQATRDTQLSATRNLELSTQVGTLSVTQNTFIPLWALFLQWREIGLVGSVQLPKKLPESAWKGTGASQSHFLADTPVYLQQLNG